MKGTSGASMTPSDVADCFSTISPFSRWSYNKSKPAYNNFTSNNGDINNDNYDCVKFTDNGWQVAEDFCENLYMPFVCKAPGLVFTIL